MALPTCLETFASLPEIRPPAASVSVSLPTANAKVAAPPFIVTVFTVLPPEGTVWVAVKRRLLVEIDPAKVVVCSSRFRARTPTAGS